MTRSFLIRFSVAIAAATALAMAAGSVRADDFYRGKQVSVYIGYGPGGGYDTYGRLVARYITQHIPGNPTTVPKNMPGAGSKRLATYLYDAAPKDGSEFGIVWSGLILDALLEDKGNKEFDASRFGWVGSMTKSTRAGIVWHTAAAQSLDDALKAEMVVGSTGARSGLGLHPVLLNRMLGAKFKIIAGYKGTADMTLAMERGELDGILGWDISNLLSTKASWLKEKQAKVFLQLSLQKDIRFPDVPLVMDYLAKDDDRQIMKLFLVTDEMAYLFIAPPSIPAERLKTLRDGFNAAVTTPAFLEDAKKLNLDVTPTSGREIEKLVRDIYSTPEPLLKQARLLVNE